MTRLIRAELFKLRKRSMSRVLLFILVGVMVLLYLLLYAISTIDLPGQGSQGGQGAGSIGNLLGLPIALPFALSIISSFGAVLSVILLASSTGNEYNWRTVRIALISCESRSKFLGAKLISALILIVIGMVIGLAVGFAMSLITTAIGGYVFDFSFASGGYLWGQFVQFWRTLFIIMPFALMAFLFAIVGRSAMPGIAIGIGVLFLEPIITAFMILAGGWVSNVPKYLFSANVSAINALANLPGGFSGGFGGSDQLPSVPHALTVLAVYIVAFGVIAFVLFHKRDVTGG